ERMQPARQKLALVDDGPAWSLQLAKQRHVAMLDQDVVVRETRNMAVERFAEQAAALEILHITGRDDRRARARRQRYGFDDGLRRKPAVHRLPPTGSGLLKNFWQTTRHKNKGLPTT